MRQDVTVQNFTDDQGNPAGGSAQSTGLYVRFQNGPLGRGGDREEPNGCFVETLLDVCRQRLEFYQSFKFECEENDRAIEHILCALNALNSRTARREKSGIEGTHQEDE